ncbi:MAG: hypothetical protein WKF96_24750 [Solirubrobacteraceae bacterium]
MATTDIAVIKPGAFLALNHAGAETREIIEELCGGQELTERHLPRAKNPSGGATQWQIPGPGGVESVGEIAGILVAFKFIRALWREKDDNGKKIALGSEPPRCSSTGPDTRAIGIGEPGGPCKTCPLNAFGSSANGRGKACKERELWFMLRDHSFMPLVVQMPTMSLGATQEYRMSTLGSIGVRATSVVTQVTLTPGSNDEGDYAIAVPRMVGMLDPDEAARAREYGQQFTTAFDAITAETIDDDTES